MADEKTKNGLSWPIILFGLAFFGMGSTFMWFMGLKPLALSALSQSWPQTSCTVVHSELLSFSSDDGDTYRPDIRVRYNYLNRPYEGGSYNFNNSSSSGREGKVRIINANPVGKKTLCWVTPNKPQQAVINRSIPKMVWFVIPFTSIFVFIGGACLAGGFGILPKSWALNRQHSRVSSISSGSTRLKPRVTRKGKFLGVLFFSVFWNGIVSVFFLKILEGFTSGDVDWFLTIFLIPFILVGLGSLGFVVRGFLALFNPKPVLHLNEGSPKLGQKVNLTWDIEGNAKKLQQLIITVEGNEKATYRVGTNTRTDTNNFYKKEILNVDNISNAAIKTCSFTIPEESMHSFKSNNNQIEWELKLQGDIPNWPDISLEYLLVIRPL